MTPDPAALKFLASRRSHPPRTLTGPAPDREAVMALLTIAARVPDHGKLEPWRFAVLERAALDRLAPVLADYVAAGGGDEAAVEKARSSMGSPLVVAVISAPRPDPKVPEWEQVASAHAVCLSLVNAALAAGWGAAWLSGPAAQDGFARTHFGLAAGESVAGLIHIGTPGPAPVPDRPRPDLAARTVFL